MRSGQHARWSEAIDRDVWDRPDDDAKRLGECDEYHVASGAVAESGAPIPQIHIRKLEDAVRERHPSLHIVDADEFSGSERGRSKSPAPRSRSASPCEERARAAAEHAA